MLRTPIRAITREIEGFANVMHAINFEVSKSGGMEVLHDKLEGPVMTDIKDWITKQIRPGESKSKRIEEAKKRQTI